MKALKIIGGVVLVIVAGLTVASFVSPTKYAVSRAVVVNKPKTEVFDYLKLLKNQDDFSVWATMDPDMKKEFMGTDGTVGFISAWDSEKEDVGKGEQEIKKIQEGQRIDYELRFKEPFEATDNAFISTEEVAEGTKVVWGFDGEMARPMNLMLLMMNMEEMLGGQPDLDITKIIIEKLDKELPSLNLK